MSNPSVLRRNKTPIWSAGIALVVLVLSLSVWVLLPRETAVVQSPRPFPAGQFQADARTVVAAFEYLFGSEIAAETPVSPAVLCASNINVQPLTSASFCCYSNQTELFSELTTNMPASS